MAGLKEDPSFSDLTSFGFTSLSNVPSRPQHEDYTSGPRGPDDYLSMQPKASFLESPLGQSDPLHKESYANFLVDGFQSNQLIDDLEAISFPHSAFPGPPPNPPGVHVDYTHPLNASGPGARVYAPETYGSFHDPSGRAMSISYNPALTFASPPVDSPFDDYGSSFGSYEANTLRSPAASTLYMSGSATFRSPRPSIVSFSGLPSSVPSLYHGSFSGPTNPKQLLSKDDKLKRRREFHNAVERRRRDLIKEKVRELGNLVPPSLILKGVSEEASPVSSAAPQSAAARDRDNKPNKVIVLNKTVDYVNHLMLTLERQKHGLESMRDRLGQLELMPDVDSLVGWFATSQPSGRVNPVTATTGHPPPVPSGHYTGPPAETATYGGFSATAFDLFHDDKDLSHYHHFAGKSEGPPHQNHPPKPSEVSSFALEKEGDHKVVELQRPGFGVSQFEETHYLEFSPTLDTLSVKREFESQFIPGILSELTVNLQSENQRLLARASSMLMEDRKPDYFNPDDFFPDTKAEGVLAFAEQEGDFWES